MKATATKIIEKIKDLPKGFEDLVQMKKPGLAEVQSFSDHTCKPYTVSIQLHSTDPGDRSILDVTCGCAATKLCHHITAMYAVAKGLVPVKGDKSTPAGSEVKETGLELISRGIETVVGGIALAIEERVRKE